MSLKCQTLDLQRQVFRGKACSPKLSAKRLYKLSALSQDVRTVETTESSNASKATNVEEIYLGFDKKDTAPRAGRKGKVIVDDPKKYPGREDLGFFLGAVGGWAGGEAALAPLKEEYQNKGKVETKKVQAAAPKVKELDKSGELLYIGFGKEETELRNSGAKGAYIRDDPRKYPDREDLGPFIGAVGGFAAGEKGLKQFVEEGELKLRPDNLPPKKQFSPITLAFLLAAAGAGGGVLLTDVFDLGETVVKSEITQAPIDDNTKTILLAAVAVLAAAGTIGAGRLAMQSLTEKMRDAKGSAQKLVTYGAFFVGVFLAARAILYM